MEHPSLSSPVVTERHCSHLRHKGMYVMTVEDPDELTFYDRYDATAGNLLAVQEEIASRIASALAIRVDDRRLAAARRRPLSSLETYECWLRGLECLRTGTVEADDEARTFFERAAPLKRLGEVDDVAKLVLFLASDESKFITGAELVIDGGLTAL